MNESRSEGPGRTVWIPGRARLVACFSTAAAGHGLYGLDFFAGDAGDQVADVVVPVQTPARGPQAPPRVDEGDGDQVLAGKFAAVDLVVGAGAVLNLAAVMNGVGSAVCAAGDDVGVALNVRDQRTALEVEILSALGS